MEDLIMVKKRIYLFALIAILLSSCNNVDNGENQNPSDHVHTAGNPVEENRIEPTCTEPGSYDLVTYCTDDGVELSREHKTIDALGHDLIHHNAKEPTCTEKGYYAYDTCSRCDYSTFEEISATGHLHTATREENRIEPTCTEPGSYDLVTYCTDDGVELSREHKTIDATDHNYLFDSFIWDGYLAKAKYVCSHNSSHVETFDAQVSSEITTNPSCEGIGIRTYTAAYDGHYSTKVETISPINHNWGQPSYEWDDENKTCTAERICKNDSTHIQTEVANSSYEVIDEPTENNYGLGRYSVTFENSAFTSQTKDVVIEKLPHYNGQYPMLDSNTSTVKYGLYPQSHVKDSELIENLNSLSETESNGWYLFENNYYAKLSALTYPYESGYTFDDGDTIIDGTTYWFKCEPITWNIINTSGGYLLLSSVLIDTKAFNKRYEGLEDGHYANNYAESDIRIWLNNEFYNSAFALNDQYLQVREINNKYTSSAEAGGGENPYLCDNTNDKVSLLSYQEYISSSLGFSTNTTVSTTRYCKTTDWARAKGAQCSREEGLLYNGSYWTRTPCSSCSYTSWYIETAGSMTTTSDYYGVSTLRCVRPCIYLSVF